jgi:hypothetical protein
MTQLMPLRRLAALLSVSLLVTTLFAAETFLIDGRKAVIHPAAKPAEGRPWLWYAPALNGGVSIVQHKLYADACQQAGIAIAGYDLGEVRGAVHEVLRGDGQARLFTQAHPARPEPRRHDDAHLGFS